MCTMMHDLWLICDHFVGKVWRTAPMQLQLSLVVLYKCYAFNITFYP